MIELVVVGIGADAADDWITCHISRADICVTADILLAARCLNKGAFVIKPNGYIFDDNNIGMALSAREIREGMSSVGNFAGGPAPFSEADRSEYLNRMEIIVRAAKKSDSKSLDIFTDELLSCEIFSEIYSNKMDFRQAVKGLYLYS